jgi:hypothetical protein
MIKFTTVMAGFLLFLVVAPMISGCTTLEDKMLELQMSMVAPWAEDKEIMLDPCPGCFHLGPLQYSEMLIALRDVDMKPKRIDRLMRDAI